MELQSLIILIIAALFFACNANNQHNDSQNEAKYVIAYNVGMNEELTDYDIWTVDPENGEKRNITNHSDVAWTYLAIEDKILFVSDRDTCSRCFYLYEMKADGSGVRKINDFLLRDSWMGFRKEGREIIVNPHPKVDSSFYIINAQGEFIQKVATGLAYSSDPAFSPDGAQIVFRGAAKKSKREKGFNDEIYLINVDGSGLKQLTHYPERDTTAPWYAYKAGPPRWHPTKNFISYQSLQNGKYSLYAVTPDGTRQWKLTDNSDREEGWHDWSPDGQWLAIELFNHEQTEFHIGLMNWESKELQILTDTAYQYQQAPVFVLQR